jgi:hypothetical protein
MLRHYQATNSKFFAPPQAKAGILREKFQLLRRWTLPDQQRL